MKNRIKLMIGSKISLLDNWEEAVLIPLVKKRENEKQVENPLIVAFDMEDWATDAYVEKKNGGKIRFSDRHLLCFTFATKKDNKIITEKWDIEDDITLKHLEDHIRLWLNEPSRHIYLVSHFSTAELCHIKDWRKKVEPGRFLVIHDKSIHFQTPTVTLIDSYAYFTKGLKDVAKFVGMEKIDVKQWISKMNILKKENPDLFWRYAENDSVILIEGFTKLRDYLWENFRVEILPNPHRNFTLPTIASVGIYIFRRDYLKNAAAPYFERKERMERRVKGEDVFAVRQRIAKVLDPKHLQIRYYALRAAMGGRREAFGCGFYDKPTTLLDFVGHYNKCGIDQPLPDEKTEWYELNLKKMTLDEILRHEGFVRIKNYRHRKTDYPIVPDQPEYVTRLMWPMSGSETYLTISELRMGVNELGLEFENVDGWGFMSRRIETPVSQFLVVFRQLREEAKMRGDPLSDHLTKLIGNALIGKFLQSVEEDDEFLMEYFGLLKYDIEAEKKIKKFGKPEARHRKLSKFFAPEWSALILGQARALLGLAFSIVHPITGHTDSMFFPTNNITETCVVQRLAKYGGELKKKYDCDGFWILRSAVYIALEKTPEGKWIHKEIEDEKTEAHHAISTSNLEKEFIQPVLDTINGGEWSDPTLKKNSIAGPKTETERGIPTGSDYDRESKIKLQWDFKRVLPKDFEIPKDVFRRFMWCPPYETADQSYREEKGVIHERKGIRRGRPRKDVVVPPQSTKRSRGQPRKWRNNAEKCRAYRRRKRHDNITFTRHDNP